MSMTWQALTLTPLDTLFFREPRPFTAGEGADAWSLFPPTPLTIQGMIRSKLLSDYCGPWKENWTESNNSIERVVGPPGGLPGTLAIRGPWLVKDGQWLLPAPLDLVLASIAGEEPPTAALREAAVLAPEPMNGECKRTTSLPEKLRPLHPPKDKERKEWKDFRGLSGWLTWDAYHAYLTHGRVTLQPGKNWWRPDMLWEEELRPGIAMDYARNRVKKGMLYFARHVRLRPGVALGLEVSGLDALPRQWTLPFLAPFGGEGRAVSVEDCSAPCWPSSISEDVNTRITRSGRFKVVLTQPAWFQKAWHPHWMNEDTGDCTYNGVGFQWVAARIERAMKIGGWDLANQRPKPLRAFVPAGSVFYFEGLKDTKDTKAACDTFWNRCISQNPVDSNGNFLEAFDRIGFGHALVGNWGEANDV
jgi:CRISPR-associated protein Cmr3